MKGEEFGNVWKRPKASTSRKFGDAWGIKKSSPLGFVGEGVKERKKKKQAN